MEEVWYCFLNKKQLGERWIVFSAAKEGRNLGPIQYLQQVYFLLLSGLSDGGGEGRSRTQLSKLFCFLTGNCALRELQQWWVQHSHQKKKRLILQTWYCQTRQLKNAALFQERLLLHRFVSCLWSVSKGIWVKSNLCSGGSCVFRAEVGFESTVNLCVCGASAVLPQECSYVKGSVTHSITVPPLFFSGSRTLCLAGRGRLCLKNKKTNFWTRSETLLFLSLELLCPMLHRRGGLLASESLDFCQTIFVPQEPPTFPFSDKCSSGRPLSFAKQCSFMSVCLKSFSSGKFVAVFVLLCTLLFGNSLAYRKVNAQL